jgi:hypothetical protein
MPPPATNIKDAVIATLKALALADIGNNVVGLWADEEVNVPAPAVVVLPGDESERVDGGDTESRETVYPYLVAIVGRAGDREHGQEPTFQMWRKQCMDAFRGRAVRLAFRALVPGVKFLEVVPRGIIEIRDYAQVLSLFLLRVTYCEPRA